jgi:hypothetical protein
MKRLILPLTLCLIQLTIFSSCQKIEGPGGTSAIRGKVIGTPISPNALGENEVIHVTVQKGTEIEHGEYWLLNGPSGGQLYYIWYNNPTWISAGDPQLTGRIGIKVDFNYSDNNTTVAQNTFDALLSEVSSDFTVSLNQDILTLTCLVKQNIPDADNGNINFMVDVANQGKPGEFNTENPIGMADDRVYLIYGENESFNESMKTGAGGEFTFEGLNPGKYKVYALSVDPLTGAQLPVYKSVEITEKGSVTDAGSIEVNF